ncbi:hypothetical protein G6L37_02335 [Agrobacterium rubi]|nr:hypothetical protein [Agrobacterium rubi]NTF24233.1 hypothetical protein [Agrobacterium rubi]
MNQHKIDIAARYGFEQRHDSGLVGFRKTAPDGGYWFVSPDERAPEGEDSWNIRRCKEGSGNVAVFLVTEPLPLEAALSEHGQLPEPEFDKDGNGKRTTVRTLTDIFFHGQKGPKSWERMVRTLQSVPHLKPVFDKGFDVTDTGGGCLAFFKEDAENGSVLYIACDDTVFGHPLRIDWTTCRSVCDGSNDLSISVHNSTLAVALERHEEIPLPSEEMPDELIDSDDWEELHSKLSSSAARP